MSIMPAYLPRNTSSLLCGLLASSAANLFTDPKQISADPVSLQNIYRLLEMYRFDAFIDVSPRGVLELGEAGEEVEINESDGELLKHALDTARNAAYPGIETQAVVSTLEKHISDLVQHPEVTAGRNSSETAKAKRFFEELARALEDA